MPPLSIRPLCQPGADHLPRRARARGVTLIELMITLAILAIALTLTLPSFSQMLAEQRLKSASQTLASALNLARSEAIKRGHEVSVCPLAAGNGVRACLADGWQAAMASEDGIWVFDDLSRPLLQLENPGQRIQHIVPAKAGIGITASAGIRGGISYQADGSTRAGGSLKIESGSAWRCLKLAANGHLTLYPGTANASCANI